MRHLAFVGASTVCALARRGGLTLLPLLAVAGSGALVIGGGVALTQLPCHAAPGSDADCNSSAINFIAGTAVASVGGLIVISALVNLVYLVAKHVAEAEAAESARREEARPRTHREGAKVERRRED